MTSFKGFFYALSLFVMSGAHQPLLSASEDIPGKITAVLDGCFPIPFSDEGDCTFRIIIDGPGNRRTVSEPIQYEFDGPTNELKLNTVLGEFIPTQKGNYGEYFVYCEILDVGTSSYFMPMITIRDSRKNGDNFVLMPPVAIPVMDKNSQTSDNYLLYLGTFSVR